MLPQISSQYPASHHFPAGFHTRRNAAEDCGRFRLCAYACEPRTHLIDGIIVFCDCEEFPRCWDRPCLLLWPTATQQITIAMAC